LDDETHPGGESWGDATDAKRREVAWCQNYYRPGDVERAIDKSVDHCSPRLDESLSGELRSVRVPAARGLQRAFQTVPSQVCLAVNQQARETKALTASRIPPERRL